ncbi:MAG: hypothetical protein QOJ70_1124 [Acidobacteriota bacterium]|jgi:hypothetical protein|nr:hypothetical protein [Acidobacteriota bacterium]
MSKKEKATYPSCPYCVNPRLFQEVLAMKPDEKNIATHPQRIGPYWRVMPRLRADWSFEGMAGTPTTRGDFWLITYTGDEFAERLKDFTAYMIGQEVETKPSQAPGPFLASSMDRLKHGAAWRYGLYFAVRITHPQTKIAVDLHWWPTHERMVTLRDVPDEGATPRDLRLVAEALKFVRVETRGRPGGFAEIELIKAIQEQGEQVTQRGVAKALGTSDRTIREWLTQQGKTWLGFIEEAQRTEIV